MSVNQAVTSQARLYYDMASLALTSAGQAYLAQVQPTSNSMTNETTTVSTVLAAIKSAQATIDSIDPNANVKAALLQGVSGMQQIVPIVLPLLGKSSQFVTVVVMILETVINLIPDTPAPSTSSTTTTSTEGQPT